MDGQMFESAPLSPSGFQDLGDESQNHEGLFFGEGNDIYGDDDSQFGSEGSQEGDYGEDNTALADLHKHIIYGALDGMLTTFAIVAGGAGGGLDSRKIMIIGISNLIADALSMGLGDALSALSHYDYLVSQTKACERSVRNNKSTEMVALTDLYTAKGLERPTAKRVIDIMAKYDDFFTNIVMLEKLGLQKPEEGEEESPWKDGFITFCSFSIFGLIPLLTYCVVPSLLFLMHRAIARQLDYPAGGETFLEPGFAETLTVCTTLFILFILGYQTNELSGKHWLRCGCEFLFMGVAVLCVAASIGAATANVLRTQFPFYFHDAP